MSDLLSVMFSARHFPGLVPNLLLNIFEKLQTSGYPHISADSDTENPSRRLRFASSMRTDMRYSCIVIPVDALKMRDR